MSTIRRLEFYSVSTEENSEGELPLSRTDERLLEREVFRFSRDSGIEPRMGSGNLFGFPWRKATNEVSVGKPRVSEE